MHYSSTVLLCYDMQVGLFFAIPSGMGVALSVTQGGVNSLVSSCNAYFSIRKKLFCKEMM